MPHQVTVNTVAGRLVVLPNGRAYNDGDSVILTDDEYHRIDIALIGASPLPVTYGAAVGSPSTAVA